MTDVVHAGQVQVGSIRATPRAVAAAEREDRAGVREAEAAHGHLTSSESGVLTSTLVNSIQNTLKILRYSQIGTAKGQPNC